MFEKVNPGHPDKMADRLAGAVVDLVYVSKGLQYIQNFMYSLGSRLIRGFFEDRKYYFYTRFEV